MLQIRRDIKIKRSAAMAPRLKEQEISNISVHYLRQFRARVHATVRLR